MTQKRRGIVWGMALVSLATWGCGQSGNPSSMMAVRAESAGPVSQATLARRVVVGFAQMPGEAELVQLTARHGLKLVRTFKPLRMAVFELTAPGTATRKDLLAAPGVQFVESELLPPLERIKGVSVPQPMRQNAGKADPLFAKQWYIPLMGIDKVWGAKAQPKPVTVAVVDTGVDLRHPDLKDALVPGYNAEKPGLPPQDTYGHGTMTAGLVGAVANNGLGIAGVAPNARIMPVKVGNSASSVVDAMIWAADNADMITMSLSFKPNMSEYPTAVETTKRAAAYVMGKNVPMVCSMGNTGTSSKNVPSYFAGNEIPGLIAVGATDQNDQVTSFSTFGNWTSVSAPGKDVLTTDINGGYKSVDGTSFSTPITAGVVALMLGHGHPKDPAAIKRRLMATALDIGPAGYDDKAGAGRVQAANAILSGKF